MRIRLVQLGFIIATLASTALAAAKVCTLTVHSPNASYQGALVSFSGDIVYERKRLGKHPQSLVRFEDSDPLRPAKVTLFTGDGVHVFALPGERGCIGTTVLLLTDRQGLPYLRLWTGYGVPSTRP